MKKALYILGVLSLLGICYAGGYHFTMARVQSEGVVPFSKVLVVKENGVLIETDAVYRRANGDYARWSEKPDGSNTASLYLFSQGRYIHLLPSLSQRSQDVRPDANRLQSDRIAFAHNPAKCRLDKTWSMSGPIEILGQMAYHASFRTPGNGAGVSMWLAPVLGCEALRYTVNNGQVVAETTTLKIGEPDGKWFDDHPEFPIVPEKP